MRTPRPSRRVAAAPSGSPDAHMCPGQGAQVIRAWEPGGHRSAEVAVLKFRGWHVCARCHRYKKNLRAILRSDSELISLSDRILLLVACRPRVRVTRACAVGMARRGAQIGILGAPCKAGGHFWTLTHGCRCRRAPQIRAMGDHIGRAAPPHERRQPRTAHKPRRSDAMFSGRMSQTHHTSSSRG